MPGHKKCHKNDCHKKCDCKNKNREFGHVKAAGYQTKQNTVYVSDLRGDDYNDGSKGSPFQSVDKALSYTNNLVHTKVYLDYGTYTINDDIFGRNIVFEADVKTVGTGRIKYIPEYNAYRVIGASTADYEGVVIDDVPHFGIYRTWDGVGAAKDKPGPEPADAWFININRDFRRLPKDITYELVKSTVKLNVNAHVEGAYLNFNNLTFNWNDCCVQVRSTLAFNGVRWAANSTAGESDKNRNYGAGAVTLNNTLIFERTLLTEEIPTLFFDDLANNNLTISNCAAGVIDNQPTKNVNEFTVCNSRIFIAGFICDNFKAMNVNNFSADTLIARRRVELDGVNGFQSGIYAGNYRATNCSLVHRYNFNVGCYPPNDKICSPDPLSPAVTLTQTTVRFDKTTDATWLNKQGIALVSKSSVASFATESKLAFNAVLNTYAFRLEGSKFVGDVKLRELAEVKVANKCVFVVSRNAGIELTTDSLAALGNSNQFIRFDETVLTSPAPPAKSTAGGANVVAGTYLGTLSTLNTVSDF